MFYLKKGMPEDSEIVLCSVKKVSYHSVFLTLDEYENVEGMMHISEIAPGRIRTIGDYVNVGKKVVCKVLKVRPNTNHVDLSLRRVNKMQRLNKTSEFKQEQKAEKLLELVGKELKVDLAEMYKEAGYELKEKYGTINNAFQNFVLDPEQIKELKIKKKVSEVLLRTVLEKIKPKEVIVLGEFTISSLAENGAELIKKILKDAQKGTIKITYMGAPNYKITVTASDYKTAESLLENAHEEIAKNIKEIKGTCEFKQIKK